MSWWTASSGIIHFEEKLNSGKQLPDFSSRLFLLLLPQEQISGEALNKQDSVGLRGTDRTTSQGALLLWLGLHGCRVVLQLLGLNQDFSVGPCPVSIVKLRMYSAGSLCVLG